jgi:hypothetical protein
MYRHSLHAIGTLVSCMLLRLERLQGILTKRPQDNDHLNRKPTSTKGMPVQDI